MVDLLYYVLRRWRRLIVWALALMVLVDLGGGYKLYSQGRADYDAQMQAIEQELSTEELDYTKETEVLTDEQIKAADALFAVYQEYQRNYSDMEEYYNNSIVMHVETNHVPTFSLQFYVDNHYEVAYPLEGKYNNISNITDSYVQALYRNEVYTAMAEAIGRKEGISFMEECISADSTSSTGMIRITVVGSSEKDARALGKVLEQTILGETEALQAVYGDFDITKVRENYKEALRADLRSSQQGMIAALQGLKNTIDTLKNSLSPEQQVYFSERVLKETGRSIEVARDPEEAAEQTEGTEAAEEKNLEPPAPVKFQWINGKYLALGLLMGLFLGCVYYAMIYLLSARLRSVNDLLLGYRLHVFGTYKKVETGAGKRFGKGLDELLEHIFRKDTCVLGESENVKRICTEMEIAIAKNGWKRIHLTGASDSEEARSLVGKLQKKLSQAHVEVTAGGSVIFDTESLEALTSAEAVILVEQLETSKYSHLEGELNICKQYQVPVMGAVVLE
ncbi:MAG: hypothetical protein NC180_09575 [Muribaculaceae bacterium]|nr:hypothetical protein [Roseburia sp.]MCM1431898.1 hypothetical protein [Muribaculaceae bacterium]MCM1493458.1 hypothetical protein [Muribaculaceae bacterium]